MIFCARGQGDPTIFIKTTLHIGTWKIRRLLSICIFSSYSVLLGPGHSGHNVIIVTSNKLRRVTGNDRTRDPIPSIRLNYISDDLATSKSTTAYARTGLSYR